MKKIETQNIYNIIGKKLKLKIFYNIIGKGGKIKISHNILGRQKVKIENQTIYLTP